VKHAAKVEADRWLLEADQALFDAPDELEKQALDHANVWSSQFANSNLAHRAFVERLVSMLRSAAGGDEFNLDNMRPATEAEEDAWHAGHASIPGAQETEDGLLVPEDFKLDSKESRRRTAAAPDMELGTSALPPPDLRYIEQWCDSQGLVMKDFPDALIDEAAEAGDTAILDEWLETHEPRTTGMWDDTDTSAPYTGNDY
jgi:hypothetical protein